MLVSVLLLECFSNTYAVFDDMSDYLLFNGTHKTDVTAIDKEACSLFADMDVYVIVQVGDFEFISPNFIYPSGSIEAVLETDATSLNSIFGFNIAEYRIISMQNTLLQSGTVDNYLIKRSDGRDSFSSIGIEYTTAGAVTLMVEPNYLNIQNATNIKLTVYLDCIDGEGVREILSQAFDSSHANWSVLYDPNNWGNAKFNATISSDFITSIDDMASYRLWLEVNFSYTLPKYYRYIRRTGERFVGADLWQSYYILRQNFSDIRSDNSIEIAEDARAMPTENGIIVSYTLLNVAVFNQPYEHFLIELCFSKKSEDEQTCLTYYEEQAEMRSYYYFSCHDENQLVEIEDCAALHTDMFYNPDSYEMVLYFTTFNGTLDGDGYLLVEWQEIDPTIERYCLYDADVKIYESLAKIKIEAVSTCTFERENKVIELRYWEDGLQKLVKQRFYFPNENAVYDIALAKNESTGLRQQVIANKKGMTMFLQNEEHMIKYLNNNIRKDGYMVGIYTSVAAIVICIAVNVVCLIMATRKGPRPEK